MVPGRVPEPSRPVAFLRLECISSCLGRFLNPGWRPRGALVARAEPARPSGARLYLRHAAIHAQLGTCHEAALVAAEEQGRRGDESSFVTRSEERRVGKECRSRW